jgi:hypothetical protein
MILISLSCGEQVAANDLTLFRFQPLEVFVAAVFRPRMEGKPTGLSQSEE